MGMGMGKGDNGWSPYGMGKGGWGKGGCNIRTLKEGIMAAGVLPGGKVDFNANALFVRGLPPDTTDLDLFHIFAPFGAIPAKGVRAMLGDEGMCKGFGFVNYIDPMACQLAL